MLSILVVQNFSRIAQFLEDILGTSSLQDPSYLTIPHQIFRCVSSSAPSSFSSEILLLSSTFISSHSSASTSSGIYATNSSFPFLPSPPYPPLIFPTCNLSHVYTVSSQYGANILSEYSLHGKNVLLVEGPEKLQLLFLEIADTVPPTPTPLDSSPGYLSSQILSLLESLIDQSAKPAPENEATSPSLPSRAERWNPPKGPIIPTLFPRLYHKNGFHLIYPNASAPIPFKTDLFEGTILLLIRTSPSSSSDSPQPYLNVFRKPTTCFEIQVQGKFLYKPSGLLFIGAEITKAMNLGLITRGICASILQFVRSINPLIHHSFGDANNSELPHITGPLWCMCDKIVITPKGEIPPKLGEILPENETKRAARRSNPYHHEEIDLDSIYSFSTNTENIELCEWAMVNVPLMKKFDLHTFWSDADIRLCAYSVPLPTGSDASSSPRNTKDGKVEFPKYHYQSSNQYIICVELQHLSNHPERPPNNELCYQTDELHPTPLSVSSLQPAERTSKSKYEVQENNLNRDSDEELVFYDAEEGDNDGSTDDSERRNQRNQSISSIQSQLPEQGLPLFANQLPRLSQLNGCILCPAVFISENRKKLINTKRELYILSIPRLYLFPDESPSFSPLQAASSSYLCTLCSYSQFKDRFSIFEPLFTQSMIRMNKSEKRRLDLQESLQQLCSAAQNDPTLRASFLRYLTDETYFKKEFLLNPKFPEPNSRFGSPAGVMKEGYVCTRVGQTHWVEEYLSVFEQELIFQSTSTKSNRTSVLIMDLLDIRILDQESSPFYLEDCYFLSVATLSKEFLVLIRGWKDINDWFTILTTQRNRNPRLDRFSEKLSNDSFRYLISQPLDWKLGDRVILNARSYRGRLHFERSLSEMTLPVSSVLQDCQAQLFPLTLVEHCLDLIFELSTAFALGDGMVLGDNLSKWLRFLTYISYLPCIDLSSYNYSDTELTCLFINLYHVLILHSFVVAGPPSTLLRWPSFFNSYSYEAFGDIFSLTELEHCIIKRGLDAPNNLIAQALIPQSVYDIGLRRKDFRLLLALNCGSLSMPGAVPIFIPRRCEAQLEIMAKEAISKQLQISTNAKNSMTIVLPQMCQLYFSLLVESSPFKNNGTLSLLQLIAEYANSSQRNLLRSLFLNKDKYSYSIKYEGLDFRCRFFTKLHDSDLIDVSI